MIRPSTTFTACRKSSSVTSSMPVAERKNGSNSRQPNCSATALATARRALRSRGVSRPHLFEQLRHARKLLLQLPRRVAVEQCAGHHPHLLVQSPLHVARLTGLQQRGRGQAQVIEHRPDQCSLVPKWRNTRPWFTFDRAAMSRIDVAAGPRSANSSAAAVKIAACHLFPARRVSAGA